MSQESSSKKNEAPRSEESREKDQVEKIKQVLGEKLEQASGSRPPPDSGFTQQIRIVRDTFPVVQCETMRLFKGHLTRELRKKKLKVPENMRNNADTLSMQIFEHLSECFSDTSLREWVTEQSERVEIESLNMPNFRRMLRDLFTGKSETEVYIDRVLLVFFFASDIIIRINEEVPGHRRTEVLNRYFEWSSHYMSNELATIVDRVGGWEKLLFIPGDRRAKKKQSHLINPLYLAASVFCISLLAVFVYNRYRLSR